MTEKTLRHGGQLQQIAKQYDISQTQWLDLSTGIAPRGYPVPQLNDELWRCLPEVNGDLLNAAQSYYQCQQLLPIAGSQSVIQQLPTICQQQGFADSRVWLPVVGYQEHHKAWREAGYQIVHYQGDEQFCQLAAKDIVVVINPNNPSGELRQQSAMLALLDVIVSKQGLLVVDEAFMDCTPEHSILSQLPNEQLIILRSVGKFFGLAGIRLGFVAASEQWLLLFSQTLGPWAVNGPAQAVGALALTDANWQQQQRQSLARLSAALHKLLADTFHQGPQGTALFQTIQSDHAASLFDLLCQHGIYVRLCDDGKALRFGIPLEQDLLRLQQVLQKPVFSQFIDNK
ncbi:threonine-phosphate decarboxylase CobD [Alteromonadaceae bacterium BrNp21-10]|nr:threonine-phosphate decarboxylase CobD [Alteromonadaceae bacterium BrNp21-10]